MSETSSADAPSVPSLRDAVRKARVESAEHAAAVFELKNAEVTRLELLRDALVPVLSQVPKDVHLFDSGILPGDPPRLFIDVIAFVEMGRDKRSYRFIQDTRYGRRVVLENDRMDVVVQALTDYVARRLVEREKALAADTLGDALVAATPPVTVSPAVAAHALEALPARRSSFLLLMVVAALVALVSYYIVGSAAFL